MRLRAMFGDALLQAHRALLKDLKALQVAAQITAAQPPGELANQLDATRNHLARHFAFEEENGYMSSITQVHPHLSRVVQRLIDEHQELLHSLDELRDEVSAIRTVSEPLREKVRKWVRNVRLHERRENALVQDAFNLDLTAED